MEIRSHIKEGIILIDKPKGLSSYDVIRRLRREIGMEKMGHSGTLDPLATGLMIVGVGIGTKKLSELIKLPKTYEAEILLGIRTTTGDMEGEVLDEKSPLELDLSEIAPLLESMRGKIVLEVPVYSAVKVKGERLYELARAGKRVNPPEKEMEILNTVFKKCFRSESYYILELVMEVTSGTYIRSIAEEIGRRLGLPATLNNLRRTKIGNYKIENALKLD